MIDDVLSQVGAAQGAGGVKQAVERDAKRVIPLAVERVVVVLADPLLGRVETPVGFAG